MMRYFAVITAVLIVCLWGCRERDSQQSSVVRRSIQTEQFGSIEILQPVHYERAAIVFARADEPDRGKMIDNLARANILSFVIDPMPYLDSLARRDDGCLVVGGDIERLNQSLQNNLRLPSFSRAMLVGMGPGGMLAMVAQLQSPDRFLGTLAARTCLRSPIEFCPTEVLKVVKDSERDYALQLSTTPYQWPHVVYSLDKSGDCSPEVAGLNGATIGVNDTELDLKTLLSITEAKVMDAPLVEVGHVAGAPLVLFMSGDGGWAGIDEDTGGFLHRHGLSVLGFSSLKFFWSEKTPDETTTAVAQIFEEYRDRWQSTSLILVGYSLGANAVPLVYNRLPPHLREAVASVILIAPETTGDLEVHITDWLGVDAAPRGPALKPEVERIPASKLLCLFGEDDDPGVCSQLDRQTYAVVPLKGGHHFDGDYNGIGRVILNQLSRKSLVPSLTAGTSPG